MKKLLLITILFVSSLAWNTGQVVAQEPTNAAEQVEQPAQVAQDTSITLPTLPDGTPTVDWLFNPQNGVFAFLLYALMYLSGFIPGLKKLDDKRLRALVVGLVLAAGLTIWQVFQKDLSWQDFAGMAFAFISTQLTYIFVLAPIPALKTPEPEKK